MVGGSLAASRTRDGDARWLSKACVFCCTAGVVLFPPMEGAKGDFDGGADDGATLACGNGEFAVAEAERGELDGLGELDVVRDVEDGAELRTPPPLATPLSNSSSGMRRCA